MPSNVKVIQDIANQIKEDNLRGKERIPTSETFIKKMVQTHDRGPDEIKEMLEQLKETHHIFSFFVVNPDPSLFVQGVEGYVFADQSVLNDLKHNIENKLMQAYESTLFKKKSYAQILRELATKTKEYNNTELGRLLNSGMMVDDFLRIVSSNAFEYTDNWRKEKLFKLVREEENDFDPIEIEETPLEVAEEKFKTKENTSSKWHKTINQFSTKFVLRIHFRKYEFDVVRKLIVTGKITEMEDFIYIRDSIKEMETMKDRDPILKYHIEKMTDLRRLCQAKINIIRKDRLPSRVQTPE
ncbi:MAG: hypothetical protein KDK36_13790 [Leptospiraceae bacterium]|nr:hypothetical protein [Leptospiraceae bacterium]